MFEDAMMEEEKFSVKRKLTKEELDAMKIVYEFISRVNDIYALYLDSWSGLRKIREDLIKRQIKTADQDPAEERKKILDSLDAAWTMYGHGPPTDDENLDHSSTQQEFKERNADNGLNQRLMSNLCLVTIYQYWEDYYRDKIAEAFGLTGTQRKKFVTSDLMGDMRHLRISIIHHNTIAKKEVENNLVLRWFKEGDQIFIDQDKMRELVNHIRDNFEIQVKKEKTITYHFHRSPSSLKPPLK